MDQIRDNYSEEGNAQAAAGSAPENPPQEEQEVAPDHPEYGRRLQCPCGYPLENAERYCHKRHCQWYDRSTYASSDPDTPYYIQNASNHPRCDPILDPDSFDSRRGMNTRRHSPRRHSPVFRRPFTPPPSYNSIYRRNRRERDYSTDTSSSRDNSRDRRRRHRRYDRSNSRDRREEREGRFINFMLEDDIWNELKNKLVRRMNREISDHLQECYKDFKNEITKLKQCIGTFRYEHLVLANNMAQAVERQFAGDFSFLKTKMEVLEKDVLELLERKRLGNNLDEEGREEDLQQRGENLEEGEIQDQVVPSTPPTGNQYHIPGSPEYLSPFHWREPAQREPVQSRRQRRRRGEEEDRILQILQRQMNSVD